MNKTTLERLAFTFAAAACLSISPAYAQASPGVRLQAGMAKEDVDGDLKSAMDIYQKIADDRSAPRDVRSKALLRLAGCYEKLGQQARKFYEQVVRDFADQPAAAQARTRLVEIDKASRAPLPAAMIQRKIENAGKRLRTSDTDGRHVVYRDDASGELIYSDLDGNHKRVIFKAKPDDLPDWFPSKDMSLVALHFP
ncbi:MAG TPA: tetratricopeptide repeat protein, partial [Bryobacteraceae bacterium]|nr:tetratricopeptide repeat protein [Bryobacteraceae bacterium]